MRSIVLTAAISLGSGCAAQVATPTTPDPAALDAAQVEREERAESERLQELQARLTLAEARSRELEARAGTPLPSSETVRIGSDQPANEEGLAFFEDDDEGDWEQPSEHLPRRRQAAAEETGPRPVLRLYGLPPIPETAPIGTYPVPSVAPGVAPGVAPQPYRPVGTAPPTPSVTPSNERLPWEAGAAPALASAAPVTAPQRVDLGLDGYRNALSLLNARRFNESLAAFDRFLSTHASHPQAANARYWRGEVFYIQRQYGRARVAFRSYLRRHARGAKVADALLKLALCNQRLGNEAEADTQLERLRREFPSSDAARLASREVER